MKIEKISGNDCGGFRPPKGHLDTQMFPECEGTETDRDIVKKTVEKRKKKKKAFNLKEYKTAERSQINDDGGSIIEGPDMDALNITRLEMLKEKLQKKFPNINWTIEAVKNWVNENFIGIPRPYMGPKDMEHKF